MFISKKKLTELERRISDIEVKINVAQLELLSLIRANNDAILETQNSVFKTQDLVDKLLYSIGVKL